MEILVVTGGIGSGKSEVCRILQEEFGCGVYNADLSVKRLYDAHPTLLTGLEELLGESLRDEHGRFVPARLASRIFEDRNLLLEVESLVFPALTDDFNAWAKDHADERFVVFESATILEKPQLAGFGDRVLVVDAPLDTRLERACMRDGADKEKISARMKNQTLMNGISEGRDCARADRIISNVGSLEDLRKQTLSYIEDIYGNI